MRKPPLLITLKMDEDAFAYFDALRKEHFPAAKNRMVAHITLFHELPGEQRDAILADMETAAQEWEPFAIEATHLMRLKLGVAFHLESAMLHRLYEQLHEKWQPWLNPAVQNRHFTPHVTVQNKATPEAADALLARLENRFSPFTFTATALDMWQLLNGKWEFDQSVGFRKIRG